ncbi:MAG: hypothetical protein IIC53_10215 [Proteobacteria bacterium]|nr:hypothetical protein [Pseudomonadota bacterium]MCH9000326.1 hypothetical protein [Pseudomonadota bacterium]
MKEAKKMKTMRAISILSALAMFAAAAGAASTVQAKPPGVPRGMGPVVYVSSQGLAYDTIVLGDLPFEGRFQKLEMVGPTGLQTEYGLGDPEYVGGRWWVDDGDGIMEDPAVSGDVYFLCPLLGPGSEID